MGDLTAGVITVCLTLQRRVRVEIMVGKRVYAPVVSSAFKRSHASVIKV